MEYKYDKFYEVKFYSFLEPHELLFHEIVNGTINGKSFLGKVVYTHYNVDGKRREDVGIDRDYNWIIEDDDYSDCLNIIKEFDKFDENSHPEYFL